MEGVSCDDLVNGSGGASTPGTRRVLPIVMRAWPEQTRVMRSDRLLIAGGGVCLLVGASTALAGSSSFPLVTLGLLAVGAVLLVLGLERTRERTSRDGPHDPARGERLARIAFTVDAVLGVAAILTAVFVAIGDARGHAVFHLLTGVIGLALFAALAFRWHPVPGSGIALFRGMVLALLGLAAFGSFVESLGGAGYDAANDARRIDVLASLHGVGVPFGGFVMTGIPIGIVTCIVVLIAHVTHREQPQAP